MEVGTALGMASLGIQVCQGLLKYYDKWRSYHTDIESTCQQIAGLVKIFFRLKVPLDKISNNASRLGDAKEALEDCCDSLLELQELLANLQPYKVPVGLSERSWAQLHRAKYPFKAGTLKRLQGLDKDIRDRLMFALQATEIELAAVSHDHIVEIKMSVGGIDTTLNQVSLQSRDTANNVKRIDTTLNQVSLRTTTTAKDVRQIDDSVKQVVATADSTAGVVQALLRSAEQKKLSKLLKWLNCDPSLDPWLDFKAARDKHQCGTGSWFLSSDGYHCRKKSQGSHLWLYGKAGCGKSVLCSTAIDDLRANYEHAPLVGFAIFFFSFASPDKQSVDGMLLALIAQLARKRSGLAVLAAARKKHKLGTPLTAPLEQIFVDQVNAMSTTFILLDALDECPQASDAQRKLLETLQRLTASTKALKLFMTSRDEPAIRRTVHKSIQADMIAIDVSQTNHDIERYVGNEIENDPRLRRFNETSKLLVKNTLAEEADGMFRWAFCQLEELKKMKMPTPQKVRKVLRALPSTLDETYERMLVQIDEVDRYEAKVILTWLVSQAEPMTLRQLAETCIIDLESESVNVENRSDPDDIINLLGSLVVQHRWLGETCVTLAHFSVQEYLQSDRILSSRSGAAFFKVGEQESHSYVADSCFVYLECYTKEATRDIKPESMELRFPLVEYARKHWHRHSQRRAEESLEAEIRLLSSEEKVQRIWKSRFGLEIVAYLGWPQAVRRLCCDTTYRNSIMGTDVLGRALHYTVRQGTHEVVAILIEAGADVDWTGSDGRTSLAEAVRRGDHAIVKVLLEAGASANLGVNGVNGLCYLWRGSCDNYAIKSQVAIIETLLEAGADLNQTLDFHGPTGLREAAAHGHDAIVKTLLGAGLNVNDKRRDGRTALMQAAIRGHVAVVKVLLDAGAVVDLLDKCGRSALLLALQGGHADAVEVIELLIQRGACVNARTRKGHTPLALAKQVVPTRGDGKQLQRIIRLLVKHGATDKGCSRVVNPISGLPFTTESWHRNIEEGRFWNRH
ncbi:hypothetical protein CKM354_000988900 [Cercospora kikuchii]|uniref:NACHT domain-containing protein n=1 Tax=Cercospora kikuchii TaxID=84275 RepID=A0A9P3CSJ2_9PEZI|nr:uncharacterized protein CKM354_000988900 [Cercospora kikuchii]GIZ46777.1 hypothetical protein CKM354_000988900 [Cercospora kikuchii]